MTDYAIVQVARALAPAIGLLGVGGIAVSLTIIFRTTLGKRSAKRLADSVEEMNERLSRIERAVGIGTERPALVEESSEIRRRLETLETIVVDREMESGGR